MRPPLLAPCRVSRRLGLSRKYRHENRRKCCGISGIIKPQIMAPVSHVVSPQCQDLGWSHHCATVNSLHHPLTQRGTAVLAVTAGRNPRILIHGVFCSNRLSSICAPLRGRLCKPVRYAALFVFEVSFSSSRPSASSGTAIVGSDPVVVVDWDRNVPVAHAQANPVWLLVRSRMCPTLSEGRILSLFLWCQQRMLRLHISTAVTSDRGSDLQKGHVHVMKARCLTICKTHWI